MQEVKTLWFTFKIYVLKPKTFSFPEKLFVIDIKLLKTEKRFLPSVQQYMTASRVAFDTLAFSQTFIHFLIYLTALCLTTFLPPGENKDEIYHALNENAETHNPREKIVSVQSFECTKVVLGSKILLFFLYLLPVRQAFHCKTEL